MINSVTLTGRLTKDVDFKYSPQGTAVASFTIAVQRKFKNQHGNREADFIQIKAFGKVAEVIASHFKKGNLIGVEGRIQTGSFEGQDGKRIYTTDVVVNDISFLESNNNDRVPSKQPNNQQRNNPPQNNQYNNAYQR